MDIVSRKYWNKKFKGIPSFILLILNILLKKIYEYLYSMIIQNSFRIKGKNIKILSNLNYRYPHNISFGNDIFIGRNVKLSSEISNATLQIMDGVIINENCEIDFSGSITICRNALISKNCHIETHSHGYDPHSIPIGKSLIIEENVWIGMGSMILSNTEVIGKNSIIAAGSIVTKPVPSDVIYGGNPAKLIKKYR